MIIRSCTRRRLLLERIFAFAAVLFSATNSPAGRIPEKWDDLPAIHAISFSEASIGLTTFDGEDYLVDRSTGRVRKLPRSQFEQHFAGSTGVAAAEVKEEKGVESIVALRTSNGRELITQNAYCDEGGGKHALWVDGAALKDHISPCVSVSCAEIVGDNFWLGTRYDGEYGEYPGEGIAVQSLDGSVLVRKLGTKEGLSGNLIRVIRLDPFERTVWVATNEGLDVVGQDFHVQKSRFFSWTVDPESGVPTVRLSSTRQKSDPRAMLFKQMRTSNEEQFYAAAVAIPADVWDRFLHRNPRRNGCSEAQCLDAAFAPSEMNVLVPFYLEDAKSSDERVQHSALANLCRFRDQRVIDFVVQQRGLPPEPEWTSRSRFIRSCFDTYTAFGLIPAEQKQDQIARMLQQEREALARLRETASGDTYPDIKAAAVLAGDLSKAGDQRGIDLINEYFAAMNPSPGPSIETFMQVSRDSKFYDWIGINLRGVEIAPAMVEGLKKLWMPMSLRTGCGFFDMRHPGNVPLFDAKYAEATLIASGREKPDYPPRQTEGSCPEAFKSQLGNSDVRDAFFRDVYPQLTRQQQELADKLSKEAPIPIDWNY
jgi:hypothetical protein